MEDGAYMASNMVKFSSSGEMTLNLEGFVSNN